MAIGTVYSDALESQVLAANKQAPGNLSRCSVKTAAFKWTCASEVAGTVVNLCLLPKGARILKCEIVASAALANSAQISIGLSAKDNTGIIDDGSVASYNDSGTALAADTVAGAAGVVGTTVADSGVCLKAAAILSTTIVPFAITSALGFGYETQKEVYVTATTSVGTISTEVVRGFVNYAID